MEQETQVPINHINNTPIINGGEENASKSREDELADLIYGSQSLDELKSNLQSAIAEGFNNSPKLAEKASQRSKELKEQSAASAPQPTDSLDPMSADGPTDLPDDSLSKTPPAISADEPETSNNDSAEPEETASLNSEADNTPIISAPYSLPNDSEPPANDENAATEQPQNTLDDNQEITSMPETINTEEITLAATNNTGNAPELSITPELESTITTPVSNTASEETAAVPSQIEPKAVEVAPVLDSESLQASEDDSKPVENEVETPPEEASTTQDSNEPSLAESTDIGTDKEPRSQVSEMDIHDLKTEFNELMGELVYLAAETQNLENSDREKAEELGKKLKDMWAQICRKSPEHAHKQDTEYIMVIIDNQVKKVQSP